MASSTGALAKARTGMRLVVRPHQPMRQFILGAVSVVAAIVIGWLLVDYSQWLYIYEQMAGNVEQKELWDRNRSLRKQLSELEERYAVLERSAQIDREAQLEVQKVIQELQEQLHQRHAELEFYRGVLAATKEARGLRIQGFRVERIDDEGRYLYSLVLTRIDKDDRVAEGRTRVWIEGSAGKQNGKLPITDLGPEQQAQPSFKFKHFQRFEGEFILPADFAPTKVRVRVELEKPKVNSVERVFDWHELTELGS
jgi:hypothetical protein